jgi:uncharacterized membrane protein
VETDRDLVETASIRPLLDGIYAIVLTLLVIELKVPPGLGHGQLGHDLFAIRWEIASFVFAFLWLVASWLSNRELYSHLPFVRRNDLLLLLAPVMVLCLIPLATSALAKSVGDHRNLVVATQFFALLIGGTNLMESINFYVLDRAGLLGLGTPAGAAFGRLLLRYVAPYPLILVVALWAPWMALAMMSLDLLVALIPSLGVQRILKAWTANAVESPSAGS